MTYFSHGFDFYRYSDQTGVETWNFSTGWAPTIETLADVSSECRVVTEADVQAGVKRFMAQREAAKKPDDTASNKDAGT